MKKIFKNIAMVAVVIATGYTAFNIQSEDVQLSSLTLENVEALASGEVSFPYLCGGSGRCYDDYYHEYFDGHKIW